MIECGIVGVKIRTRKAKTNKPIRIPAKSPKTGPDGEFLSLRRLFNYVAQTAGGTTSAAYSHMPYTLITSILS